MDRRGQEIKIRKLTFRARILFGNRFRGNTGKNGLPMYEAFLEKYIFFCLRKASDITDQRAVP